MKEAVKKLMNGVIISCQAYEDTPLYGSDYMSKMAMCAVRGGANGVRGCWPQDVKAIRQAVDVPIVGIYKKTEKANPLEDIIITPDFESAKKIIEAGCDILGIDCTIRPKRGFDQLKALLEEIRESYPNIAIMADLATIDEAVKVSESGLVDIISSTLAGYTGQSCGYPDQYGGPDVKLIREMKKNIDLPINGEGRIWELSDLKMVLDAGADMVTIGTAVTRPHLITERFTAFNRQCRGV